MQNTRLNNLLDVAFTQLRRWLQNPWRRISLVVISLLLGVFLGTAIPTTAGQAANWDVIAAGFLIIFTETVNRFVYSNNRRVVSSEDRVARTSLFSEMLNGLKIGLTYSLFIEAFKLGS